MVLDSDDAYDVAVSRTRLQPLAAGVYRVWFREEWPPSLADDRRSRVRRGVSDFACGQGRYRVIVPAVVEANFVEIEQAALPAANVQPWETPAPGTGGRQILEAVCAWAAPNPPD